MKLFLLTVVCLAVASAAPTEKKKRGILPGDARYGTDHHHEHHHHENEVEVSQAAGGYVGSYVVPDTVHQTGSFQVPQGSYGPPNYNPPAPLNNAYLTPVINAVKQPSPAPIYGAPNTHAPQQVSNTYLEPVVQDVKQSPAPSSNYGVPVQSVKTTTKSVESDYTAPSVEAPVTSYGTPVVSDVQSVASHETKSLNTEALTNVHVQASQPVVEQHRVEEIKTYTTPDVKAVGQAPVSQGHVHTESTEFKSGDFGAGQSFLGGSLGSNDFGSFGSVGGGFSQFPSFQSSGFSKLSGSSDFSSGLNSGSSLGSSLYSAPAATYGAPSSFDSGFSGFNTGYQFGSDALRSVDQQVQVQVPQYPAQISQHVPFPVSVPHTVEVPKPYFVHVPQQVQVQRTVSYPLPQYVEPQVHQHVEKSNPVYDFFQNNLQNPFQNVQLPSFQLPSLPFLKPTSSPAVVDVPSSVEKFNVGSHVESDSVAVDNPQVKSAPVKSTSTTFTHSATSLKATKEYTQPTDSNGGYVY